MAAVEAEPYFLKLIMLEITTQGNIDKTDQVGVPETGDDVNDIFVRHKCSGNNISHK